MKIAMPVNESGRQATVSASFGRAPFFLIYDLETKESNFVENSARENPGGAGIKAAQIIVDHEVSVVLTPRCGENAAQVLASSGIKLHKTSSNSVENSIESFVQGKLPLLQEIHSGLSHHGGD